MDECCCYFLNAIAYPLGQLNETTKVAVEITAVAHENL